MEQRQAIQVYRVAVTSGLANPCFISPSFMPPSMQAFSPIQCSSSPILSLHIRSPSKLVGSPICPGRAHSFSCSRDTICTKYSRSTGRSCFFGPRVRLVNGRRFSVWGRDGDIRDVNIVAGTDCNKAMNWILSCQGIFACLECLGGFVLQSFRIDPWRVIYGFCRLQLMCLIP